MQTIEKSAKSAVEVLPSSRRLNICMISDDFLPAATGVGIHIQRIAAELQSRGHKVSIITTRRADEPEYEVWNGVKVYRTYTIRIYGFYQALPSKSTIQKILQENNVDIVHYHYLSALLIRTYKASRSLDIKHVYTYHMTIDHLTQPWPLKPLRPFFFWMHVRYCNRFDLIFAPSPSLIRQVESYGIHTRTQYITNPAAFDAPASPPEFEDKKPFIVLYVGRLNPEKNLPYLLQAFQALAARNPDVELRLAGEGDQKSRLIAMCEELGISQCVDFLGFVKHEELAKHYTEADVFVLPSLVEAQPMVVLEAMRFALPIIVTKRMVSAAELVDDGVTGFIVDPDSVADLAEKINTLATDSQLRQRLGHSSLVKSERYRPEAVVDSLESFYLELL